MIGLLIVFTTILITVIIRFSCKCCSKRCTALSRQIEGKIFYNGIIRYLQTSLIKLCIMQVSILALVYSAEEAFDASNNYYVKL